MCSLERSATIDAEDAVVLASEQSTIAFPIVRVTVPTRKCTDTRYHPMCCTPWERRRVRQLRLMDLGSCIGARQMLHSKVRNGKSGPMIAQNNVSPLNGRDEGGNSEFLSG
jgi:hypothetical protein